MPDWNCRFLSLAAQVATWSKDPSTKCGAVVVRPDRTIASLGYNGFPRGVPDLQPLLEVREEKYKRVIHAEMNALLFLHEVPDAYTLYTWPFLPCCRCAAHVIQKGIMRVVAPGGAGPLWDRHNVQLTRDMFAGVGVETVEVERDQVLDCMRDVVAEWGVGIRRWHPKESQGGSSVPAAGL